jgi:hypothetical protein
MSQTPLRFVVADDPELDHLTQEAWLGDQEVADLRLVNGEWRVTFFSSGQLSELSWNNLKTIFETFSKFKSEQSEVLSPLVQRKI